MTNRSHSVTTIVPVIALILCFALVVPGPAGAQGTHGKDQVQGSTFVGADFGQRVSWSEFWTLDESSLERSENQDYDWVGLTAPGTRLDVFVLRTYSLGAKTVMDQWIDIRKDSLDGYEEADRAAEGRSIVTLFTYNLDGKVYGAFEVRIIDDGRLATIVEISVFSDQASRSWREAVDGIDVAGSAPFQAYGAFPECKYDQEQCPGVPERERPTGADRRAFV